jgi:hypothetical protein
MTLSLLPLCLSFALPQGPAPITEVVPLEHLVQQRVPPALPPWGTMLQQPADGRLDLLDARGDEQTIGAERIATLLGELAPAAVGSRGLQLAAVSRSLLATGEPADVAQVKERLRQAAAVLARPVTIEVAVWDAADREVPPAFLAAADWARFAGNRTPLWRRVATACGGEAVALEQVRWSRYVRDVEVEVAQKQAIARPATAAYGDGVHAVVRAFPLFGTDEFAVHVQFAVAQRRGVLRPLPTGMPAAPDLELPTLETDFGACCGRIANGGALALTLRGRADCGGQRIVTVRATSQVPPPPAVHDGFGLYPCGALTTTGLTRRLLFTGSDPFGTTDERSPPGHGHVPAESLAALVRAALGPEGEAAGVECGAGWLFVRGGGPLHARVDAVVRGLQDRLVRNVTIQHTGVVAGADGAAAAGAPGMHELVVPALAGRDVAVGRCLETNVVAELYTAIAQEAASLDPMVDTLQSGCWLAARATLREENVHLQLHVRQRHAAATQTRSVMPGGGTWMPTEVAVSSAGHDGPAANGQAIEHGDGPTLSADGRGQRTLLLTTVRW